METVKVGLLGYGTVSSGFYRRLERVKEQILAETGRRVQVLKVLVREGEIQRLPLEIQEIAVTDFQSILEDSEIQVIVEAINGAEPAATYICNALEKNKHVVSANKAAIACHWERIQKAAENSMGELFYEASVCAGVPIIQVINTLRHSDKILRVEGIVNGTSNYILTTMADEGITYEAALEQAQALGYAEADPSADVDGWDAANKLSILSGLAFNQPLDPAHIQKDSLRLLKTVKKGTKLIAAADCALGSVPSVQLKELEPSHPLYAIEGVDNGVVIITEGIGTLKLIGPGAGADPTGTAMVSDLLHLLKGGVFNDN